MASSAPLQEFITCNICFEIYNHPQSLKCHHVYCHDCIQKLRLGAQVQCPDCREISSISDVKNDFRTQSLIDDYNRERNTVKPVSGVSVKLCDICQETEKIAKSFCKVCHEYICMECERVHRRSKATKEHKLIELIEMMKEKKREIKREIKKMQDKRTDISKNVISVDRFARQLLESKEQLTAEVNTCRNDIKRRVDEHHDGLIEEINSTIDSLQETLKEAKTLFAKCDSQLEEKVSFLSDVSNVQDYSLMTDTLSNLTEQIEKELQQIDTELPKLDPRMTLPATILKGEEWSPQTSTQIKVQHMREMTPYNKVNYNFYTESFILKIFNQFPFVFRIELRVSTDLDYLSEI